MPAKMPNARDVERLLAKSAKQHCNVMGLVQFLYHLHAYSCKPRGIPRRHHCNHVANAADPPQSVALSPAPPTTQRGSQLGKKEQNQVDARNGQDQNRAAKWQSGLKWLKVAKTRQNGQGDPRSSARPKTSGTRETPAAAGLAEGALEVLEGDHGAGALRLLHAVLVDTQTSSLKRTGESGGIRGEIRGTRGNTGNTERKADKTN